MTVQPTPNMGAQPTTPSQPIAHHADSAHWAFRGALLFWAVAVLVDWAGAYAQGVAGIVLGGIALGVSVAYAAQYDRQQRITASQDGSA